MAKGQAKDRAGNEQEIAEGSHNGTDWRILAPWDPDKQVTPYADTHTWGCWPVLAIETGGYNDYEVTDPYTGRKFWARAWDSENPYNGLRKLVDAMETAGFLDDEQRGTED